MCYVVLAYFIQIHAIQRRCVSALAQCFPFPGIGPEVESKPRTLRATRTRPPLVRVLSPPPRQHGAPPEEGNYIFWRGATHAVRALARSVVL